MKYGELVRDLASRGANWQFYDTNFRYLKQRQPASLAWNGHRMGGLTLFSSPMVTVESSIVVVPVLVVISSMSAISVIGCIRAPNVIFVPPVHHPAPPLSLPNPDLPTPVRLNRLASLLIGYSINETQFLIFGFQNGFPIYYDGPGSATMAPNLLSAHQHPEVVDQYTEKELSSGRLAGPFPSSPFPYFSVSPLGVVPKKSPG